MYCVIGNTLMRYIFIIYCSYILMEFMIYKQLLGGGLDGFH